MHRSTLGRIVPAALTAIGVAVPAITAAGVMLHSMIPGSATPSASSSSGEVAQVSPPSGGSTSSGAAAKPTATPATKPAATATPHPTAVTTHTITGPAVDDPYGVVQAVITVTGRKITNVSITAPEDNPRSASINSYAVPALRTETLLAQSANVSLISGATLTSEAYIQSLQAALKSAGI